MVCQYVGNVYAINSTDCTVRIELRRWYHFDQLLYENPKKFVCSRCIRNQAILEYFIIDRHNAPIQITILTI